MSSSFFADLDTPEKSQELNKNSFFSDLPESAPTTLKEHAERKVGGPALEFVTHAVTSIPNFIDSLKEMGVSGMNALFKKAGIGEIPKNQLKTLNAITKQLGPTAGIPMAEDLMEEIHKASKGKFRPKTEGERILQKGAAIAGSVAGFGPEAALGTPVKALGTAAMGATTAALEEEGVNPWLALGGGIVADMLTRSGASALKKVGGFFKKGVPKTAGELISKTANIKPEQINNVLLESAERLGIKPEEIPLSAQIRNPFIQGIESKVRASSLAGPKLAQQLETAGKKVVKPFEEMAESLSARQEALPGAISQEAVESLQKIKENAESTYTRLYDEAARLVPEGTTIDQRFVNPINKTIEKTIKSLRSDLGTPGKETLAKRLEDLSEKWKGITPTVKQIEEAKKDINKLIKYDVEGGFDKYLEPLAQLFRSSLRSYGKLNRPFGFRFQEAERMFGENAKTFRKNPMMRSLVKGNAPEQIINKLNSVKGIRDLEKVMSSTPEGKEAFNALKRYKLEQMIGKKLLNKKGEISWGNASGMLKDAKTRELAVELVGPENYKKLKDMVKVSSGIEEGLRKFLNTSQTATTQIDMVLYLQMVKAISLLFAKQPIKALKSAGVLVTPRALSSLMTNPEFIEAAKKTALAGKGKDINKFLSNAKRTIQFILPNLLEQESEQEKSPEENQYRQP